MEDKHLRERAVESTLWSFVDLWGNKVGSFVVFFVLVRLLSPEAFGLLSLAWVFIIFVQNFADLGFTEAIIQREELSEDHLDTAFWTTMGTASALAVTTLAALPFASRFVSDEAFLDVVGWLVVCVPLRSLTRVQNALLMRAFQFKMLTLRSVVATLAGGTAGVGMALHGYGVWSLVGQQIVFQLASTVVLWNAASWGPSRRFSRRHFRELLVFGRSVMGARVTDFANRRLDTVLIGIFLGPLALGYYAVAAKIVLVLTESLTKVISSVTLPVFSRIQADAERLRSAYYAAVKLLGLLILPAFLGLVVSAPVAIPVVFGDTWRASIPVMQALAVLGVAQCLFNLDGGLLLALGKPQWRFQLNVVSTAASLAAFFLAYSAGIVAVAVAFAVRGYLLVPVAVLLTRRLIAIDVARYLRQYRTAVVGAVAVAASGWLVPLAASTQGQGTVLMLQVVLGIAVYAAVATAMDGAYLRSLVRMGRRSMIARAP